MRKLLLLAAILWCAGTALVLAQQPYFFPTPLKRPVAGAACNFSDHTGQLTTWNPSDKNASITLSGSNFTASYSGSFFGMVRAVPPSPARHTGKWYYAAHVDSGNSTQWVFGADNGATSLGHYPGGQDKTGVGGYAGNWVTQGGGVADGPQGFSATLHAWIVVALDLDNNLGWLGGADSSCIIDSSGWSGPVTLTGNPSTGTDGINLVDVNTGVSVMPAWGGASGSGTGGATLYTNTPMSGSTLAGFKYWDQP